MHASSIIAVLPWSDGSLAPKAIRELPSSSLELGILLLGKASSRNSTGNHSVTTFVLLSPWYRARVYLKLLFHCPVDIPFVERSQALRLGIAYCTTH